MAWLADCGESRVMASGSHRGTRWILTDGCWRMCGRVVFITQVAYGVTVASTPVAVCGQWSATSSTMSPQMQERPNSALLRKKLSTRWETKFGEEIDEDRLYLISVERILHMEDFNEGRVWVVPSEYSDAEPDPLRNFAESVVEEMNSEHAEDVHRIYSIYAKSDFQALDVKMIWVDRLGFDLHVHSEEGIFAVRIPFSRQVSDQKAVKSSFNMMAHHAWEVDKSYATPEFEKVQFLKKVT